MRQGCLPIVAESLSWIKDWPKQVIEETLEEDGTPRG
jgi:hypothetical protein